MGFLQLLELGGVSGGSGLGIGKLLAELHGTGQMLMGQCLVLLALAGDALDARGQARDLVLEAGLCLAQCVQLGGESLGSSLVVGAGKLQLLTQCLELVLGLGGELALSLDVRLRV